jgi:hypothetical protein
MSKIFLLLAALTATLYVTAQTNQEPFMTKSLANDNVQSAKVETSGGNITVNGVSGSEARIEVYVRPSNSKNNYTKDEIQKKLQDDYDLNISVSGGKLTATAKPKKMNFNWNRGLSISFKIWIPVNSSTELATSGGNITMANLNGTQNFKTSGGNLNLDQLSGNIKGKTSGGNIDIKRSKSEISLHTSGGNIQAEDCDGNLELATSGGNVTLKDLDGYVQARTSGGNVNGKLIKGDLMARTSGGNVDLTALSASVNATTSGGFVKVEVVELGKYVTISNSGGHVDLTLPGNKGLDLKLRGDKINTGTLKNFSGKLEKDEVNGTLNGGGIPVTVRNSGGINLSLK